jgi:hypothetical protein
MPKCVVLIDPATEVAKLKDETDRPDPRRGQRGRARVGRLDARSSSGLHRAPAGLAGLALGPGPPVSLARLLDGVDFAAARSTLN